ncbi:radical SAM protein, partial [bacterium]|nr:radical SAM protein [bacterium]
DKLSIEEVLQYINENKPLLVGFTAFTIQIKAAGFIANEIKKHFPDSLICCGGPHVIAIPRETLEQFHAFDFVVYSEAEVALIEILKNLKAGRSLSNIKGVFTNGKNDLSPNIINNLDHLPFPAWEEFDLTKYLGSYHHRTELELPMSTSRGCPFSCIFCCRSFGRKRRHRSISSIIKEIERNIDHFGCKAITFYDETFIANLEWSKELFKTMISRGLNKKIKWACETRVDNCSAELFRLMKKAGCNYVFFGFESADDNILKN